MSPVTASIVLHAITGVGALVWLLALRQHLRCARENPSGTARSQPPDTGSPVDLVEGSVELEGEPAALCTRAASVLASQSEGTLGAFRITDKRETLISFDGVETFQRRSRTRIRRGELRFEPAGAGRTRASYWAETSGARSLLVTSAVLLLLGCVALCCGYFLFRTFVVASPSPNVRAQSFQILHVGHLLWPPFMCSSLYRRARRAAREGFEALVSNLPYIAVKGG